MQSLSNTRIQIPSHPIPGASHRVASVTGTKQGIEEVRAMVRAISAAQSSVPVMSGNYHQYDAQQQQQQQQGGAYSAEWAAYHAAQQAAAAAQAPAQAAQPIGATDTTYHEQFFRHAYYYGEEAARAHYGEWSPPVGTPNPYGENPNLQQQQGGPATAVTQPTAAAAPASVDPGDVAKSRSEAVETSRRRVSNLPAWMTKK